MIELLKPYLVQRFGGELSDVALDRLRYGLPGLKKRSKTITELIEKAGFYVNSRPIEIDSKARKIFDDDTIKRLAGVHDSLVELDEWREDLLEKKVEEYMANTECTMKDIAQGLRVALTGATISPGIFEVLAALGRDEALGRVRDVLEAA